MNRTAIIGAAIGIVVLVGALFVYITHDDEIQGQMAGPASQQNQQ